VRLRAWQEQLWRDQRGVSLIEYALLVSLVTSSVLMIIINFTSWANGMWSNLISTIPP
jgi:Flp pilus assembly pilin Flp